MKRLIWVFVFLYGCDSGSSSSPLSPPPPVPEYCGASIIWEAPVLRRNGLPLSPEDFEKFTIYVGETPGRQEHDLIMVIDVPDGTATTHRIEGLPYRMSYIYLTVTDTEDRVSSLSKEWFWNCVIGGLYEPEEG